jgi:3-hydroxyisobutyrate dehydrogenase-like beta-hydroxyacid dehydrogenase
MVVLNRFTIFHASDRRACERAHQSIGAVLESVRIGDNQMSSKVGFIGLGSQGAPMARRMIDAGWKVVLWARRPETLAPYRETAAEFASSPAELAAQVEHVGLCVVNDADVREVCGQLFPAMRPGARIAIHSTVHPDTCRELARDAASRGLMLLDAPVSGGAPAAEAGALTVMVGGETATFEAARPIFATFGRLIVHLGEVGAGQNAKLVNNALLAANLSVAHHAIAAGAELGVARDALVQLLLASSGRSFGLEVCSRMPAPTSFAHGAALLAKDVGLLVDVLGRDNAAAAALRDAAEPFIKLALARPPA